MTSVSNKRVRSSAARWRMPPASASKTPDEVLKLMLTLSTSSFGSAELMHSLLAGEAAEAPAQPAPQGYRAGSRAGYPQRYRKSHARGHRCLRLVMATNWRFRQ